MFPVFLSFDKTIYHINVYTKKLLLGQVV